MKVNEIEFTIKEFDDIVNNKNNRIVYFYTSYDNIMCLKYLIKLNYKNNIVKIQESSVYEIEKDYIYIYFKSGSVIKLLNLQTTRVPNCKELYMFYNCDNYMSDLISDIGLRGLNIKQIFLLSFSMLTSELNKSTILKNIRED